MKIIVSLTTWSKRISDCRTTIESMLKQNRRPDAIELNLDLENFPRGLADIPDWLKEMEAMNDNLWIYFRQSDIKCYQKFIPTIRRHCGTRYILVTADDDQEYPTNYLERIEKNMENADWLCTTHDVYTFGQYMSYGPRAIGAMLSKIDDDAIKNCPLDDHLIFHLMNKFKLVRGKNIGLQPKDLELGYSFRRYWLKDDPANVRHGDYPREQFVKERAYMQKRGIV